MGTRSDSYLWVGEYIDGLLKISIRDPDYDRDRDPDYDFQ